MKDYTDKEIAKWRKSMGDDVVDGWLRRRNRMQGVIGDGLVKKIGIARSIKHTRQALNSVLNKPTRFSTVADDVDTWLDENAPEKPTGAAQGQCAVSTDALDAGNVKRLKTDVLDSLTGILSNPHCSLIGKTQAILDHADALKDLRVEGTDHG